MGKRTLLPCWRWEKFGDFKRFRYWYFEFRRNEKGAFVAVNQTEFPTLSALFGELGINMPECIEHAWFCSPVYGLRGRYNVWGNVAKVRLNDSRDNIIG